MSLPVILLLCFFVNVAAAALSVWSQSWYLLPVNIGCALLMLALLAVTS